MKSVFGSPFDASQVDSSPPTVLLQGKSTEGAPSVPAGSNMTLAVSQSEISSACHQVWVEQDPGIAQAGQPNFRNDAGHLQGAAPNCARRIECSQFGVVIIASTWGDHSHVTQLWPTATISCLTDIRLDIDWTLRPAQIELQAKLLDYFLGSNKCNINQPPRAPSKVSCVGCVSSIVRRLQCPDKSGVIMNVSCPWVRLTTIWSSVWWGSCWVPGLVSSTNIYSRSTWSSHYFLRLWRSSLQCPVPPELLHDPVRGLLCLEPW